MGTPASSTAPSLTCPSCQAPVAPGSLYCNRCGARLTSATAPAPPAAPSPSAGAPAPAPAPSGTAAAPVDIRSRVEADRGVLKRLQLLIPGFRGYRLDEDIRAADNLLRMQVADKVHRALTALEDCRSGLAQANQFGALTDLANGISDLMVLEGRIRHAEQGYSGISATVRVRPNTLDRLYEYDFGFAQAADQLAATVGPLRSAIDAASAAQIPSAVATVRGQVRQLDTAFTARMRAIEGIQV